MNILFVSIYSMKEALPAGLNCGIIRLLSLSLSLSLNLSLFLFLPLPVLDRDHSFLHAFSLSTPVPLPRTTPTLLKSHSICFQLFGRHDFSLLCSQPVAVLLLLVRSGSTHQSLRRGDLRLSGLGLALTMNVNLSLNPGAHPLAAPPDQAHVTWGGAKTFARQQLSCWRDLRGGLEQA